MNVNDPASQLITCLENLEGSNLSNSEKFDNILSLSELLYGFGFKDTALRQLKYLAQHYPKIHNLQKIVQSLDPTWVMPTLHNLNAKETLAEAEFDISVLDD